MVRTFLICLVVVCLLASPLSGGEFYVAPDTGSDEGTGSSRQPWATLAHAAERLTIEGGTLHLAAGQIYREPLVIKNNQRPIVIEGHGAVIDLGTDISEGPWIPDGDGYILARKMPRRVGNAPWQMATMFVSDTPIFAWDPREGAIPRPGRLTHLDDGRMRVVFPAQRVQVRSKSSRPQITRSAA